MNQRPVKPLVFYVGGKYLMAKHIIPLFDYSLDCYIELFFGGGSIFWQKKPHKVEIINDQDNDLINLYRMVKSDAKKLQRELECLPYSRTIYCELLEQWKQGNKGSNDFERAVRFFYLLRSAFSGLFGSGWGLGFRSNLPSHLFSVIKCIKWYSKRLQNAAVENRDFREILDDVKRLKTNAVIYADPPYFGKEYYYKTDFTLQDHIDLATKLNDLKDQCQIIVSYYDCPLIDEYYSEKRGWKIKRVKAVKTSARVINGEKKPTSEELIIYNYVVNAPQVMLFNESNELDEEMD